MKAWGVMFAGMLLGGALAASTPRIEVGEDVELAAGVEGSQPIQVSWFLEGEALGTGNPLVWETGGLLPGFFLLEARASNAYGSDRASEFVEVVGRLETGWIAEACRARPCVFGQGQLVVFSSDLPAAVFYGYDWVGDGAVETWALGPVLEHVYSEPGEYRATVTLVLSTGGSSLVEHPVPLRIMALPPLFVDGFEGDLEGWSTQKIFPK